MSDRENTAKSRSTPNTGLAATLSNLFRAKGTSAPSSTTSAHGLVRPHAKLLALLAISLVALFATTASASAAPPSTTCCTISNVSYTSVHLTGTVTTDGSGPGGQTAYAFQYSTDGVNWSTGFETGFGMTLSGPATGKKVDATFSVPKGGTEYFVRLLANNGFYFGAEETVASPEPNPSFTTLAVDPPSVIATDNASEVAYTTATVKGKVNRPANADPAFDVDCHFQYVTDEQYQLSGFTANPGDVPCEGTNPIKAPGSNDVQAHLTGLADNTTYHLRLLVSNASPTTDAKEAAATFTTLTVAPPSVVSIENASDVEYTQAQVKGVVERPDNADPAFDVECNFEYISDAQFKENEEVFSQPGFTGATPVPCNPNPVTAADTAPGTTKAVSATLSGLSASTTYHLRLSASNQGGSDAEEAAATFTTVGPIPKPVVLATDDAEEVKIFTAQASGEVERPAGADPALDVNCRFEYISDQQFDENIANNGPTAGFEGAGAAYCAEPITSPDPGHPAVKAKVEVELAGLKPETTYHLRLVAENNAGGVDTQEAAGTFTTLPAEKPVVTIDPVEGGTYTTAHVTGTVTIANGHFCSTSAFVQISTDGGTTWSDYSRSMAWHKDGKSGALGSLCTSESPAGEGLFQVELDITGLQPSTTYSFRIYNTYSNLSYSDALANGEIAFSPEPNPSITTEPPSAPATGENLAVSDITATTAHFSATVNPNAPAGPLSPAAKKAYETKWHFECTPECKDANGNEIGGTVQGEEGAQPVAGDVKRLDPNTDYEVRLVVSNEGGGEAPGKTFETDLIKPTVKAFPGGSDGKGGYVLQGTVNPNASEVTDCTFGWGPGAPAFGGTKPTDYAFQADCSPKDPGAGAKSVTVEAPLTGLNPGSRYQFRLFATNEAGEEMSEILEFTPELAKADPCANEQQRTENKSLALPECRAYEMVSPPGKEGFGATLDTYDGGDRVLYFSGAGNIAKSGQGFNVNSYVAERTAAGWETIPNLNGSSGSLRDAPNYVDSNGTKTNFLAYSPDLSSSVWSLHRQGYPGGSEQSILNLRSPDGTFAPIGSMKDTIGNPFGLRASSEYSIRASADLSHVVSVGTNEWGPGAYEYVGTDMGQPRRVDIDNAGAPISSCIGAQGNSKYDSARTLSISPDGSRIVVQVFGALSAPPVPGTCGPGAPPANEIWARINGTTAVDVSASHCDRVAPACNAPANHNFEAVTPDASRVFFTTTQQLVDEDVDQANDIYACDLPAGNPAPSVEKANHCAAFRQVSAGDPTGAAVESVGASSENGATVLFTAKGVLADNEDAYGEKAVAGDHNLYAWRTDASHPDGQTAFVGRLGVNDLTGLNGNQAPQATPDGRYLVFTTATPLLDTDTDSARDVYRYDADSGELTRVSTNINGVAGNNDAFPALIDGPTEHNLTTAVSDDGTKIVFTTAEPLNLAVDNNDEPDVHLWTPDRVSLISTGAVGAGGTGPRITASGHDIYFETTGALTPPDPDADSDVYDARIGGGFSFVPKPVCTGEKCQPDQTPPSPNPPSPANTPNGEGNVKPPKPCPKGKVRKKNGKCAKKHKKGSGKKHHGKKASHNRGGGK